MFCLANLGENQELEMFPIGRRLAFDSAKGRLWVVCRACERWNLVPLQQRWETIDDCDRRFHISRSSYSTENIGIARLPDGLELVRVGRPRRKEFAYWRYGDQFGRRRRSRITRGTIAAAGAGTVLIAGVAAGVPAAAAFFGISWVWPNLLDAVRFLNGFRTVNVLEASDGLLFLRRKHLKTIRLEKQSAGPSDSWLMRGDSSHGLWHITGRDALVAAFLVLPAINSQGAGKRSIGVAVDELDALREPGEIFTSILKDTPSLKVSELPQHTLLALEMAAAEDHERAALESELGCLELAWRRAEEIAEIADSLLTPDSVESRFTEIRRERDGMAKDGVPSDSPTQNGGDQKW